ncbi:hypothetical protein Tco_0909420 [Tanacetum coccineum]|uniref:Uncharacterized protein n=1 Tax=Tanacetum coccineum TaxID=301880 RepID=A0ABQ5CPX1_9ASTR
MNPFIAQQVALDDALVAPEDRVEIGKCNMRIDPTKTQKEATYQVVIDTLSLSPYYNAFLITADVPKIYMHQAVNPKKARKRTKAIVTPKKKSSFTTDDNIIPDLDVALELGKSISKIKVEEHEEARKIHETHECLVTAKPTSDEEFDAEPARRPTGKRRQNGVVFRDTSTVSKKKTPA